MANFGLLFKHLSSKGITAVVLAGGCNPQKYSPMKMAVKRDAKLGVIPRRDTENGNGVDAIVTIILIRMPHFY